MALFSGFATLLGQSSLDGFGGLLIPGGANLTALSSLTGTLGDIIQPQVSSAVPSSSTVVRISFDKPMANNAALVEPANYGFTPGAGGAAVTAIAVTPEATTYPNYVDVQTSEHTKDISYTVQVSNVTDRFNNLIDPAGDSAVYTGQGVLPQLSSVEVRSSTLLRLHFDEDMTLDAALVNPSSYTVVPITPGAAPVFFTSVLTPEGDNFPNYVELPVSEMTDGATYEATVSTSGPVDRALNTVDPANNDAQFTGVGVPPTVSRVISIGGNRVDVVFNEPMLDNADIRTPAKYQWDNGLATLDVLDILVDTAQLVTSDQQEGVLYTLTIIN